VRALQPETAPRILVADTVGFIRNLSHALIASFRSTLEEAREAGLLLYVVDASDAELRKQLAVTRAALRELGVEGTPSRVLLHKVDRVDAQTRAALAAEFPEALLTSAHDAASIAELRRTIVEAFSAQAVTVRVHVPFERGGLLGEVHASARVLEASYDERGVWLELEAAPSVLKRLEHRGLELLTRVPD
jgi:GTP-binding protein HflX